MIATIAALVLASAHAKPLQQAELRSYVRQYEAAIEPAVRADQNVSKVWGTGGFEVGSDQAIRLSAAAQSAAAACPRSVAALREIELPDLLPEDDVAAVAAYHRDKIRMYGARCQSAKLTVAYVDDPTIVSRRAALERSWARDEKLGARAGKQLRPVFRAVGVPYPKDWA